MSKRKAVDEAFFRMFHYEWGKEDEGSSSSSCSPIDPQTTDEFEKELIGIFGRSMASKILCGKRQRLVKKYPSHQGQQQQGQSYGSAVLPSSKPMIPLRYPTLSSTTTRTTTILPSSSTELPEGTVTSSLPTASIVGSKNLGNSSNTTLPTPILPGGKKTTGIDAVLAQIAEPTKTSTVQKTSNDWESFKGTDKQLQDELEKKAQSKDALLVRQDFLLRVDNRKFEIEREGRERDRAKRGMNH